MDANGTRFRVPKKIHKTVLGFVPIFDRVNSLQIKAKFYKINKRKMEDKD